MKHTVNKRALAWLLAAVMALEGTASVKVSAQENTVEEEVTSEQESAPVEEEVTSEQESAPVEKKVMAELPSGTAANSSMETAAEMRLGEEYRVTLGTDEKAYYKFTPQESGGYAFYSIGEYDTQACLYDREENELTDDDDSGETNNFNLSYDLQAGDTYYLKVSVYDENSNFTVAVEKRTSLTEDGAYTYLVLDDGTIEIVHYKGNDTNITIPAEIDGKRVTRVGEDAFNGCSGLTSIVIPNSVTSIGSSAFKQCSNLESVTLPENLTELERYAFKDCSSLVSIEIPDHIKNIELGAFKGCTALSDIVLPQKLEVIEEYAFKDCTALSSINLPLGLKKIEMEAFCNCSFLKAVTIPNSVAELGEHSLGYQELWVEGEWIEDNYKKTEGFTLTGMSDSIAESYAAENGFAFVSNGQKEIAGIEIVTLPEKLEYGVGEVLDTEGLSIRVNYKDGTSVEKTNLFTVSGDTSKEGNATVTVDYKGYTATYEITVDNRIGYEYRELEDGTIEITGYRGSATSIKIPEEIDGKTVTAIGHGAFYGKSNLTEVTLPEQIKRIGGSAFGYCPKLTGISIPPGVIEIGQRAFGWVIDHDINPVKQENFTITGFTNSAAEIYAEVNGFKFISNGEKKISKIEVENPPQQEKFGYNEPLNEDTLWGLQVRVQYADGSYAVIEEGFTLKEPDMSTAGEKEVTLCYKEFQTTFRITVGDGLEYVELEDGTYAVDGYHGYVKNLTIPQEVDGHKVTKINELSEDHKELESVVMPDSITYIGTRAFYGYTNLSEIRFSENISYIGRYSFEGTAWLANRRNQSPLVIEKGILIDGTTAQGKIEIPTGVSRIVDAAFCDAEVSEVTIPDTVIHIGNSAFWGCKNLYSVEIPENTYDIGDAAFGYLDLDYSDDDDGEEFVYTKQNPFTIKGSPESAAQSYAEQNGFTFQSNGEKIIEGISIYAQPDKTVYGLYEKDIDMTGLAIRIHFTDGSSLIRMEGFEIGDVDNTKAGKQNVSVTYQTFSTNFTIEFDASIPTLPESKHLTDVDETWTIHKEGARALAITFSKDTRVEGEDGEYICIYDKNDEEIGCYVDKELSGKTIVVNGDTAKIHLFMYDWSYGFKVTKVEETDPVPSVCEHDYAAKITKQPTCKEEGEKTYTCTICGDTYTEKIAKTEHTVVTDKAVAATCTEAGKTEGSHCSVCGTVFKTQESIPAKGHTYKTTKTQADAAKKKNGSIIKKCTVCGETASKKVIYYPKTITLSKTKYTYNGKVQKPSVTVKDSKGNVIKSSNYTVSYSKGCKSVGKYTVAVKFKGNYSGTVKKTFTIIPKGTSLTGVSAKSKGFTAKWKKQSSQTTGYQIQYSTSSKFTGKDVKTTSIKKNSSVSKSITKLKAKKKYYVRVRTYKTVKISGKNTNLYSGWSKAKSVTTKK